MKRRLLYGAAIILLGLCVTFVIWQGSFRFDPESLSQVFLYWAVSSLVFILTVVLGFILCRTAVKLYIERQSNREGSRIKTKLVVGALALSFLPVVFLVLFSVQILNFNLVRWFSRPAEDIKIDLAEVAESIKTEIRAKADAQARWLAALPEAQRAAAGIGAESGLRERCRAHQVVEAWIIRPDGSQTSLCSVPEKPQPAVFQGKAPVADITGAILGDLLVLVPAPLDLTQKEQEILTSIANYDKLSRVRKETRQYYLLLMVLISLFILFVATWIALFLAKQISVPISALLKGAREVKGGNLSHRVKVSAVDELATLVRAFNEMTQDLESNERELERRRRFTEAILENIPTGVISAASDGRILRTNRAVRTIFPGFEVEKALRVEDLFPREDVADLKYLMKRARRTGVASRQFEIKRDRQTVELSVVISVLEENMAAGYVMVIEDSSETLRAQKAAAWHEVARRVAHEIKNPLTPISLCSQRILRQLDRISGRPETLAILRECSLTISQEVESVRILVDEFSQFSRFPVAQPVPMELNTVVESALAVFEGRLDDVSIGKQLAPDLPLVALDPEQFKRAVVNLVDNAAEAMQESALKRIIVSTTLVSPEIVELVISDSGQGISSEDRQKLFLPYFSTKGRGTGLGLAIVSQIVSEHKAQIRIEDNIPSGARFVIEIPAIVAGELVAEDIRTTEAVG